MIPVRSLYHFSAFAGRSNRCGIKAIASPIPDEIVAIKQELKSRAGDKRSALVPLFTHPNPQVRLMAAQWALAVAPQAARQALQDLSDRNIYPQAAYVRQTLMALDRGDSKLI
jgi:hypothetical protein